MAVELPNGNAQLAAHSACDFTDAEMAYVIKDALKSALIGEIDSYNRLVGVIYSKNTHYPEVVALLVTSLRGIALAASYIDISYHKSLLVAIFKMSLWDYGEDVMDELQKLIISLAASNGKLLNPCLDMLVRNFTPATPYFKELMKLPIGLKKKNEVLKRVHEALIEIANYVPLAPMTLLPLLDQRMPHITRDESDIVLYVENMLKLESSEIGEGVGSTVLLAVVDRLVELDILIESLPRKFVKGKTAEKLDSLMVLTFKHLESCAKGGRLNEVFETLLQSFQITVLKTYKSKFTQFVLFYACALDAEGCGVRFAEKLANIFLCHPIPLTRIHAVAYLASFLSRGKFLSLSLVTSTLESLVAWCAEYCQILDCDNNSSAHHLFYFTCQEIMYVLCFRMKSVAKDPRLKTKLFLMLEQILKHPLSPLKVCLPSRVQKFLQRAKEAGLLSEKFVFDDMPESEFSKAFGGSHELGMFFPFDPCLLKKSDSFIKPNYVYDEDEDDIDEGSSDEDGVENTPKISMPAKIRPSMSAEHTRKRSKNQILSLRL